MLEYGVRDYRQFEIEAEKRRRQGDREIWAFGVNRGKRIVEETIAMVNSMSRAPESVQHSQKSRMQVLHESLCRSCECPEAGLWLRLAEETLRRNGYDPAEFCTAVVDLLRVGRSKARNVILVGGSNCGKSFLLRPLQRIYACFCSPAFNSYSFAGVEDKEIIFLDDWRFSAVDSKPIPWGQMLLLLDGAEVNLSRPRNIFADDFCLKESNTIPVFATGIAVPVYFVGGVLHELETGMMRNRFKVFDLEKPHETSSIRECPACARCFVTLLRTWDSTAWVPSPASSSSS